MIVTGPLIWRVSMGKQKQKLYRDGATIVVLRCNSAQVLVCHRIATPLHEGWQFPQGGINAQKDLVFEALRELHEETGIREVTVVKTGSCAHCYDYPPGITGHRKVELFRGQSQRWVMVRMRNGDSDITFGHQPAEFDAFQWVAPQKALAMIVGFKRECYANGLKELGLI